MAGIQKNIARDDRVVPQNSDARDGTAKAASFAIRTVAGEDLGIKTDQQRILHGTACRAEAGGIGIATCTGLNQEIAARRGNLIAQIDIRHRATHSRSSARRSVGASIARNHFNFIAVAIRSQHPDFDLGKRSAKPAQFSTPAVARLNGNAVGNQVGRSNRAAGHQIISNLNIGRLATHPALRRADPGAAIARLDHNPTGAVGRVVDRAGNINILKIATRSAKEPLAYPVATASVPGDQFKSVRIGKHLNSNEGTALGACRAGTRLDPIRNGSDNHIGDRSARCLGNDPVCARINLRITLSQEAVRISRVSHLENVKIRVVHRRSRLHAFHVLRNHQTLDRAAAQDAPPHRTAKHLEAADSLPGGAEAGQINGVIREIPRPVFIQVG